MAGVAVMDDEIFEQQSARLIDFKFRQLEAASAEINGQK
jgi:hypothetical protein